jgi:glycosyltransferase involved in cell wall biosynthesis/GNAT superfamily N-acetyltransferase
LRIAHLTTADISLRYLVLPQLEEVNVLGGESIGISAPGEFVPELTARGIIHIPLTNSTRSVDPGKDVKTIFELWRILRTEKPDVLHTHTPKPGIYGRIIGRLAGVPVVVNTIHGLYATRDDPFIKRAIVYTLEAIASRFSDRELVQSAEDFKFVTDRRITRRDRTILLGNGVDLSRFDPARVDEDTRRDLRASIGAADGDIVVGSVGRLVAEKGFPELFEAATKLAENCIMVAIGPEEPDKEDGLQAGFVTAAREQGIHLPGMQTNVDEWYAAMDIFVLASHREGFPRAAMEAASMALPVIATDIRGCREVVDHAVNGILVPVNDSEGLADAITELASSPEKRHKMGEASREKALATFDERRIVDTVLEAQISALREKGRFHVLRGSDEFHLEIRRATKRDTAVIARLHADSIDTGFLRTLGVGFLRKLYSSMLDYDGATILVATDPYGPVAFVAGVSEVRAFYRHFAASNGLGAGVSAAPRLIRPSSWRKVWDTATYDGDHQETGAELLSMAVAGPYRRRGLGRSLSKKLLDELAGTGILRVKVVVGADNIQARKVYEAVGFIEADAIEVHKGEKSLVLVSERGEDPPSADTLGA